jgi:hypothetical protein
VNVLVMEPWDFTLYEDGDRLILSVLAGGVGLFEVPVALAPDEVAAWHEHGVAGLQPLIKKIRGNPGSFASRRIQFPS